MYQVYVIQSDIDKRLYAGMSQDPKRRLQEHNSGKVFSTKGYKPWKIVYSEMIGNRKETRIREKYLKSGCGKEFLKALIYTGC